jgi:tetratricopeptide (TPR) repeat protein
MSNRVLYIILVTVIGISLKGFSQNDSLAIAYAAQKNIKELQEEQKQLNFQKFFFEALSQKAIENYDKAIIALEKCQNIDPNNAAVYFELSKNYFAQWVFYHFQYCLKEIMTA